jgi:DNA polymerase-3 subunit alpha
VSEFVHLHSHTCFSLLDGLARIDDLLHEVVEQKMPALALTDHGTMFAAIEFYKYARQAGVKPIIGCEVYVADRSIDERPGPGAENYHLTLLAENEVGYRNLIQLTTEAHVRGFYRKPRVDHALLEKHADGLICLSGCASGELATAIVKGDRTGAEQLADWYRQVFPDRYYLEMQNHDLDFQAAINEGVLDIGRRLSLPYVATNDVHYVWQRQAYAHEVLLCIQTQTTMSDPKRMRMQTQEFYLKSAEQMAGLFGHVPGAIGNTLAIAERCNLELEFGRVQFPAVELPAGRTAEEQLRMLCAEGMARRYPSAPEAARQRLEYELEIIERTGFVEYLLLVHDVIHFARRSGIAVGPGRGSAAGSIVAYCLFVTNVDPVAHGLSFERFLNPERVTMPDMDLDFADDRRDEVIRYVTEKFGRDRVAQIITFGTIGPRAGVRDVGRALGMAPGDVDRVAKLVPFMCSKMGKAKEEVAELQQLYDGDPAIRRVLDTVEDLEGVARHASTHAAGVVIARDPLREHVPLYKVPKNDQITTQYAMSSIEQIGLLKMDFLGLRTLTILERACGFVRQTTGAELTPDDIPLDDPAIYELLSSGETFGVFQVDGQGMRKFIRQLRPTEFEHVVALEALYRPGPMSYIEEFAARKNGEREVTYDHPALEEVLRGTYGIVVYQEQVMKLAVLVAGYTMGEGDLLRRAMGKKKPEELAKHREQFIDRAEKLGTSREVAAHLFNVIEPFAGYAFNKAHSAAYAVITCQTAYLKAKHPREYMAGYLSAERENSETVSAAMAECRRLGIGILPPDVNYSDLDFTLEEDGIRFGLTAIKNVGAGAVESILAERRERGPFTSLEEFCARVDWTAVNKRVVESLARCGAFDSLGIERGRILASADRIVAFGNQLRKLALAGQASLFGDAVQEPAAMLQLAVGEAASLEEKLAWEQELLGLSITRHPVVDAEEEFRTVGAVTVSAVSTDHHNRAIRVGGLIQGVRSYSTKAGQPMASFSLTDFSGVVEAIVFSRIYEQTQPRLVEGTIVVVDGKLDANDGRIRLLVDCVSSVTEAKDRPAPTNGRRNGSSNGEGHGSGGHASNGSGSVAVPAAGPPRRVTIELRRGADREADIARIVSIYAALQQHPGQDEVEILVRRGARIERVPLPNPRTGLCARLEAELQRLVGDEILRVAEPGVTM